MKIVSIDPSLRHTGLAYGELDPERGYGQLVVHDIALIETEATKAKQVRKNSDDLRCAQELATAVLDYCLDFAPDLVIAEVPSGTQSSRASWTLGITLGILATVSIYYRPLIEVSPTDVKKHFIGSKTASKQQMIDRAVALYPDLAWHRHSGKLTAKNEHMADAIAIMDHGVRTPAAMDLISMRRRAA